MFDARNLDPILRFPHAVSRSDGFYVEQHLDFAFDSRHSIPGIDYVFCVTHYKEYIHLLASRMRRNPSIIQIYNFPASSCSELSVSPTWPYVTIAVVLPAGMLQEIPGFYSI